jgi:hypothetical protein
MSILLFVLHMIGAYPVWRCWQANRGTSLQYAVVWSALAWAGWGFVMLAQVLNAGIQLSLMPYVALCLSSCAGVTVLGARRPGDGAWNFVVVGLLAVLLLPIAEGRGQLNLSGFWIGFLGITQLVIGFNYGLTRFGPAALVFLSGCGCVAGTMIGAAGDEPHLDSFVGKLGLGLIAVSPWLAFLLLLSQKTPTTVFDQLWRDFRNRFGMIWALRVRDQFNRSAKNASWPAHLGWTGLNSGGRDILLAVPTLEALLKRFGPRDGPISLSGQN